MEKKKIVLNRGNNQVWTNECFQLKKNQICRRGSRGAVSPVEGALTALFSRSLLKRQEEKNTLNLKNCYFKIKSFQPSAEDDHNKQLQQGGGAADVWLSPSETNSTK